MPTYAQLNLSLQEKAGAQLRTFDKTMTFNVAAHIRVYGFIQLGTDTPGQFIQSTAIPVQNGPATSGGFNQRFEYTGAADSLYNNYLDSGIYTGARIYSQDVIDSISNTIQRTVDQIESRITNRSISALLCHGSCHVSCHTSRGRR